MKMAHLPEPRRTPLPYTPVAPLPAEGDPTPRRQRTIVCGNLTIDGERWDVAGLRQRMKEALKGDKADVRCAVRPGIQVHPDYARDVCLSSWCRTCPFYEKQPSAQGHAA